MQVEKKVLRSRNGGDYAQVTHRLGRKGNAAIGKRGNSQGGPGGRPFICHLLSRDSFLRDSRAVFQD